MDAFVFKSKLKSLEIGQRKDKDDTKSLEFRISNKYNDKFFKLTIHE